jgi:coenzyme F420-0:L-glutamate ligase/coenzyme F420-1:gamma-L-glutamate ligase
MNTGRDAIYAILATRRSIRSFKSDPISRESLERILIAAGQAPSAHHQQPWRFLVVSDTALKEDLADRMAAKLRRDRLADGDDPTEVDADAKRSITRITSAPVVVLMCLTMEGMDQYADAERAEAEYTMAVQGVAMAGENLMLAAHAEGLGTCWMCAPLFAKTEVQEVLDLPEGWIPQGMIMIGHPAQEGRTRERLTLGETVIWR